MAQHKFLTSFQGMFSSEGSTITRQQDYLYGLRGVLAVESFLWLSPGYDISHCPSC